MSIQSQLNQMLLSTVGSGLAVTQSPGIENYIEYKKEQREKNVSQTQVELAQQDIAKKKQQGITEEPSLEEQLEVAELEKEAIEAGIKTSEARYKTGLTSTEERARELYGERKATKLQQELIENLAGEIEKKRAGTESFKQRKNTIEDAKYIKENTLQDTPPMKYPIRETRTYK